MSGPSSPRRPKPWLSAMALCSGLLACERGLEHESKEPAAASAASAALSAPSASPTPSAVAACDKPCSAVERCSLESGKAECKPNCPKEMVYIPATGSAGFEMGRGEPGSDDQKHTVVLSQPFCMDATEVTVRAYKACVQSGKCTVPQLRDVNANYREEYDRPDHPVNMVNWKQAGAYCAAEAKSLPTEAQWEYAASRGDGRKYPWGNDPEPTCENHYADFTPGGSPKTNPAGDWGCGGGGTSPVKAHPLGKVSWPQGDLFDMGGNVWEWTADCFVPYPRGKMVDPAPTVHPNMKDSCYVYALRGGGWNRSPHALRTFARAASKHTYRVPGLGFRCVKNAQVGKKAP